MRFIKFGVFVGMLCIALAAYADTLALREDHPQTYIVKKGDTLWDISSYFLKSPWLWPRLWQANPQVENPHLIYPGDQLKLIYINGQPQLVRKKIVKIMPQVRTTQKTEPVPTLPLSIVHPFLSQDHIVSESELENAPFIIGNNRGQVTFQQDQIAYAQGDLQLDKSYGIYRRGRPYIDKDTEEVLGFSVVYLGTAKVTKLNNEKPHTIKIIDGIREMKINDLLLPMPEDKSYPAYFTPNTPQLETPGYIIDSYSHRSVVSKYDIVLINKGSRDGLAAGDVFGVEKTGAVVVNNQKRLGYKADASVYSQLFDGSDMIPLPNERLGALMIFRAYDKLSYALIIRSPNMMKVGDSVTSIH